MAARCGRAARFVAQAGLDHGARHAVHDAGFLGLGQHCTTSRLDPGRAVAAVGAHAGHDHAEDAVAVDLGGRLEQDVHGRPVRRVERPDVESGTHACRPRRDGT